VNSGCLGGRNVLFVVLLDVPHVHVTEEADVLLAGVVYQFEVLGDVAFLLFLVLQVMRIVLLLDH
jgi:hypothetical protein